MTITLALLHGISTSSIVERVRLGESARAIAVDCGIEADDVLAAIRWERWTEAVGR